jgi:ArsR family transcriptional regulator
MKALSDPNRVTILKMLGKKELCVCEITSALGLAQSTVSKHLKILEEAELVAYRKKGPWIFYNLVQQSNEYAESMLNHLHAWLEEDAGILGARKKLETVDLRRICAG